VLRRAGSFGSVQNEALESVGLPRALRALPGAAVAAQITAALLALQGATMDAVVAATAAQRGAFAPLAGSSSLAHGDAPDSPAPATARLDGAHSACGSSAATLLSSRRSRRGGANPRVRSPSATRAALEQQRGVLASLLFDPHSAAHDAPLAALVSGAVGAAARQCHSAASPSRRTQGMPDYAPPAGAFPPPHARHTPTHFADVHSAPFAGGDALTPPMTRFLGGAAPHWPPLSHSLRPEAPAAPPLAAAPSGALVEGQQHAESVVSSPLKRRRPAADVDLRRSQFSRFTEGVVKGAGARHAKDASPEVTPVPSS